MSSKQQWKKTYNKLCCLLAMSKYGLLQIVHPSATAGPRPQSTTEQCAPAINSHQGLFESILKVLNIFAGLDLSFVLHGMTQHEIILLCYINLDILGLAVI